MNILIISHMYPRPDKPGYGTFIKEQAISLIDAGNEVCILSPAKQIPRILRWIPGRFSELANISLESQKGDPSVFSPKYFSAPKKLFRDFAVYSCMISIQRSKAMNAEIKKADVIVAHTALFDGRLARHLSMRYNKEYYVYIHGEDLFQNTYGLKNIIKKYHIKRVLRDAKGVITVSEYMKKKIESSYEIFDKVFVNHNGVDLAKFRGTPKTSIDSLRIISASFLIPRKAQRYLIEALAGINKNKIPFFCEIAGDGPERESLEALVEERGLSEKVSFSGQYLHDDFPKILKKYDLFVLPSWDEAFGVVYVEAMAMGLPAIAADDAGAVDIISNKINGYIISPRDTKAIAGAIESYVKLGEKEKIKMSEEAINRAQLFSWEDNANRLTEIIKKGR